MSTIDTNIPLQIESLPAPYTLKQEIPLSAQQHAFIIESRRQIEKILRGEDKRLLLIVGPCSIHNINGAKEYAEKLHALAKDVSEPFLLIMRAYFEKPRTSKGWKGLLYDPHLNDTQDMATGLRHSREVLLALADFKIPAATEFLDPATPNYIGDLISWSCIGARTAESQVHRQFASGLPMPVAFKNSTSGNVDVAINGVLSAKTPHAFFGIDESGHISIVRTKGNPHAHIVLRGGESHPNYDPDSIAKVLEKLQKNQLAKNIIVDCSHDNSRRDHEKQMTVFQSIIEQSSQGNDAIKGLILESNLSAGCQPIHADKSLLNYAVSLTDPCLDWKTTEALIRNAASQLHKAGR